MRYNERALVVGKTRSGKSTFARYLFAHMTGCRRIVANVKGKLDAGAPPVSDVAMIDWGAPIINWVPASFRRDVFEDFYMAAWAHRGVPTILWTDENAAVTSPGWAPDGWMLIQQQGGEWEFGHLVVAQRCKNNKMEARTEAEEFYIFADLSQPDLDWIADEIGEVDGQPISGYYLRQRLRALAAAYPAPAGSPVSTHAFLRWTRASGLLEDCAPLDPGWVGAPLLQPRATSRAASAADEGAIDQQADDGDELELGEYD